MTLSETKYTPDQKEFLNYLKEIGAVLDTVIFDTGKLSNNIYAVSKNAAKNGIEILGKEFETHFKLTNPNVDVGEFFKFRILPDEELQGEEISFTNFIGEGYHLETGKVNVFSYDREQKIIHHKVENGLAKALINPPYSLQFRRSEDFASKNYEENESLFFSEIIKSYLNKILHVYWPSDSNFLKIISWSDNWTNYFDDGKEWWGTFCWTIYDSRKNIITFIAASSTD